MIFSMTGYSTASAEHNSGSLKTLLGAGWVTTVEDLRRIGFIETVGESWKIPAIYRSGLEITQGAAFEK